MAATSEVPASWKKKESGPGRPKSGYWLADGRTKVSSVTTIVNRFDDKSAIIGWAGKTGYEQGQNGEEYNLYGSRDEGGDIGRYVHDLIQADLDENEPPEPPKGMKADLVDQAQQGFTSFIEWRDSTKLVIESSEIPLVSEHHRFGGTPDGTARSARGLALADWKSSKAVYLSSYILQLVGYEILWNENHPDDPITAGFHLVRFGKSGTQFTHSFVGMDNPVLVVARMQFLSLVDAFARDKILDRLKA